MADYALPSVVEKRVRYFDGQFLQAHDFIDEQDYQLDREHRVNRLLHGPGIAEGLTVTSAAPNQVTVAPGTAIDSDGRQLILARATTVDLPAAMFNDKRGVQLLLSYRQIADDRQILPKGSDDFTRWLERPDLTALAPGESYKGAAPPVLLAEVALDTDGRVLVDPGVRSYSGLRLPGAGPDAATLRATSGGPAQLTGSLTVDGNVGIGTTSPEAKLHVHGLGGDAVDLFVNGRLRSDNNDGGLWISTDRFVGGYDLDKIGFWGGGDWRLLILPNGNVGIGTTNPGAKLEVAGEGGMAVDLVVSGRIRSSDSDGGLWISTDRLVGGFQTDKIGFYNGEAWRLAVLPNGNVGIGTTTPAFPLHLPKGKALRIEAGTSTTDSTPYFSFGGNGVFNIDTSTVAGGRFTVQNNGNVGIGTTETGGFKLRVNGGAWINGNVYANNLIFNSGGDTWKAMEIKNNENGVAGIASTTAPSDVRLKADLRPIGHALDLVRKLQGVRYRWSEIGLAHFTRDIESSVSAGPNATEEQNQEVWQAERRRALDTLAGDYLGLVAQDVEPVVPELVHEGDDGYKRIRYQHLTALLTEAIKEQDAVMRALSSEVAALRARLSGPTA